MRLMWIAASWRCNPGRTYLRTRGSLRSRQPLCRFQRLRRLQSALCEPDSRSTPVAAVVLEALKQRCVRPGPAQSQRAYGSHCSAATQGGAVAPPRSEASSSEPSEAAARLETLLQVPVVALGLDISLQNTGYAYVRSDSRAAHVLTLGHVRTPRTSTTYDKVAHICAEVTTAAAADEWMQEKGAARPIRVIGVEAYMRRFAPGRFRTSSLFRLAELNTLIAYEMSRRLGCLQEPAQVHPSEARAWFGLSSWTREPNAEADRNSVKEVVFERVRPWLEARRGSTPTPVADAENGTDEDKERLRLVPRESSAYDESDAFVIAHYTMVLEQERQAMADPALYFAFLAEYGPLILAREKASEMTADVQVLSCEWARKEERASVSASLRDRGCERGNGSRLKREAGTPKASALVLPEFARWIAQTRLRREYGARFLDRIERARRLWIRDTIRMHWGHEPRSLETSCP